MHKPNTPRKMLLNEYFYARSTAASEKGKILQETKPKSSRGLRGGYQTIITKLIKNYAEQFKGKTLTTIDKIIRDMSSFERIVVDKPILSQIYAKRTAEDIIGTRKIILKKPVQGCVDYTIALCSVLRAKGIPAYFKRDKRSHSTTLFRLDNKWYRADPTPERVAESFHLVKVNINTEEKDSLAIGVDAWDIGLTDFNRFNLQTNKSGTKNAIQEDNIG